MDETKRNYPKRSRSVGEMIELSREYIKLAKIVVGMTEEDRADFFDWWQHERHVEKTKLAAARRGFRDLARKVGVME